MARSSRIFRDRFMLGLLGLWEPWFHPHQSVSEVYLPGPGFGQHGGGLLRSISHAPGWDSWKFFLETCNRQWTSLRPTKQIQGSSWFWGPFGSFFWLIRSVSSHLFNLMLPWIFPSSSSSQRLLHIRPRQIDHKSQDQPCWRILDDIIYVI